MRGAAPAPLPARPHLENETRLRASGAARIIAGLDEAGRGPLAGILPPDFKHRRLHDSKRLSARVQADLYRELTTSLDIVWACAVIDAKEVDRLNILRATHEGMRRAFHALTQPADHALIDGLPVHPFPVPHTALVGGDAISLSIAAASVIAKVTRDRLMDELDSRFPAYGFSRHKGYATSRHLAALAREGPCPVHRYTFRPVAQPLLPFTAQRSAA